MKQRYLLVIEKGENNYSGFSPDVEGCIATGDTVEDTVENLKGALEFHIEALSDIPQPKGLKYYLDNGTFNDADIAENYFIAYVELQIPAVA